MRQTRYYTFRISVGCLYFRKLHRTHSYSCQNPFWIIHSFLRWNLNFSASMFILKMLVIWPHRVPTITFLAALKCSQLVGAHRMDYTWYDEGKGWIQNLVSNGHNNEEKIKINEKSLIIYIQPQKRPHSSLSYHFTTGNLFYLRWDVQKEKKK